MDIIQDWASYLLGNHVGLPPYAGPVLRAMSNVRSFITPLVDQLFEKPDLATIALLLVIALISLKILNMLWQAVMFWVRLVQRIVFWGSLVALGLWMYTRGPSGVAADLQQWYEVWNGEYEYWKKQEHLARIVQQNSGSRSSSRFY